MARPESYTRLLDSYLMQRRKATQDYLSTDEELCYWIKPKTFWALVWPSALVASQYIVENPTAVAGRRVIELVCGMGLPGCCAATLGAQSVLLTDGERHAVEAASASVAFNGLDPGRVDCIELDWRRIGAGKLAPAYLLSNTSVGGWLTIRFPSQGEQKSMMENMTWLL